MTSEQQTNDETATSTYVRGRLRGSGAFAVYNHETRQVWVGTRRQRRDGKAVFTDKVSVNLDPYGVADLIEALREAAQLAWDDLAGVVAGQDAETREAA